MENRYKTRQQTAQAAMDVQDACNTRGVLKAAWDMACFIGQDGGDPTIRQAPEMVLMLSKLSDMFGQPGPDVVAFGRAWEACEALAKGEPAQV